MISTSILKSLAAAGSVSGLTARGVPGGYVLIAHIGLEETPLQAYRGQARVFKRLDTVASYVHQLGLDRFDVKMTGWSSETSLL